MKPLLSYKPYGKQNCNTQKKTRKWTLQSRFCHVIQLTLALMYDMHMTCWGAVRYVGLRFNGTFSTNWIISCPQKSQKYIHSQVFRNMRWVAGRASGSKKLSSGVPSVLWRSWLGGRKGIRPVKNRVVGYWHGYLSGARCRLAYGSADGTATHCLLLQ